MNGQNESILNKDALRNELLFRRNAVADRAEKEAAIAQNVADLIAKTKARAVMTYISMGSEVDTRGIIGSLMGKITVIVPFTKAGQITPTLYEGTSLTVDRHGNLMQTGRRYDEKVDISLTPLVGFNADLHRIGYGKGCYDRFYANADVALKVGLAFDEQYADFVSEAHDIPLDMIITPTRVIVRGN